MTLGRGAAAALLVALALLTTGCSTVDAGLPGAAPPAAPPTLQLDIEAPAPLEALLRDHLDLARLPVLAPGEAIGEPELDRLVAATPAQARGLLETEGYFEPVVTVTRDGTAAGGVPRVQVRVEPGPRVRIALVTIEVQGELEERARRGEARAQATVRALHEDWPLPAGEPFRNAQWGAAKNGVLARLRRDGYLGATWSGTGARIDVGDGTARLFVVADSGPLFRTGELRIEGLKRYEEDPVRHLAGFAPGTAVTEELLVDYQERLVVSGLFETATVTVDPDVERAAAAPVLVRVREREANEAIVGIGFSTNVGPRASLDLANRRVFGLPGTARNRFEIAQKRQSWNGELSTYPGRGFWRTLVGGSYSREESDTDVVTSWAARIGRSQDTKPIDRLIFAEVEQSTTDTDFDPGSDLPPRRTATSVTGNYHFVWRRLDDVILPTDGLSMSLQAGLGYAFSDFTSNGPFTRLYGRFTGYRPLPFGFFGQARVELGDILRKDRSIAVPEAQLFRPGGEGSVRGYDYRSLGPVVDGAVVGGSVLFTGSVELARPVSARLPSVWWAVFVDAGRAAFEWRDLTPAVGAGFGVRWRSPIGPLAIDLAYGDETNAWRTHLSVGVVF
jgi:translocation and assembly module TamA